MTAVPPPFPEGPVRVEGLGLVLRQWSEDDLDAMVAVFDNPEADRFTPIVSPFDRRAAADRLTRSRADQAAGRRICLAITEDDGVPMGEVLIFRDEARATGAEIGYGIGPRFRGRGLASRSVRLMIAFGYDTIGVDRLVLRIDEHNEASHAVARATGFAPDGEKPVRETVKGREKRLGTWIHRRD